MEAFLSLLPTLLGLITPIASAIETGVSVNSIGSLIQNPTVLNVFQSLGTQLFPKAAPAIALVGSLIASYSPNYVKWMQGMLNVYLKPAVPLVVDGSYGPKTTAAVEAAQTKLGLKIDGVAGDITMAALNAILNPPVVAALKVVPKT
jgi:peptidoglycan hydrolase-like protein with peptidoglycan-binding domain